MIVIYCWHVITTSNKESKTSLSRSWRRGIIPRYGSKKSLNQKSGSVKTFSIVKLVYMEVFITFDKERESGPKDKHTNTHTHTHTNQQTNIKTYNID